MLTTFQQSKNIAFVESELIARNNYPQIIGDGCNILKIAFPGDLVSPIWKWKLGEEDNLPFPQGAPTALYLENNLLYVGGEGNRSGYPYNFWCIDVSTSKLKWRTNCYDLPPEGTTLRGTTKIISQIGLNRLFFVTDLGIFGCLDKETGLLLWWNSLNSVRDIHYNSNLFLARNIARMGVDSDDIAVYSPTGVALFSAKIRQYNPPQDFQMFVFSVNGVASDPSRIIVGAHGDSKFYNSVLGEIPWQSFYTLNLNLSDLQILSPSYCNSFGHSMTIPNTESMWRISASNVVLNDGYGPYYLTEQTISHPQLNGKEYVIPLPVYIQVQNPGHPPDVTAWKPNGSTHICSIDTYYSDDPTIKGPSIYKWEPYLKQFRTPGDIFCVYGYLSHLFVGGIFASLPTMKVDYANVDWIRVPIQPKSNWYYKNYNLVELTYF
jgi:hypothetical protein